MSSKSSHNKLAYFVLVLSGLILISSQIFKGPFGEFSLPKLGFSSNFSFMFKTSKLPSIVENSLKERKGYYGIYIEDLADEEKFALNEKQTFSAASLFKLYMMAAILKDVEDGNLSLDEEISDTKSHLIEVFGDIDFGYEDAPSVVTYTIDEALERVGRISDNFASIMLVQTIGREKLQQIADQLQAKNTSIQYPLSTTSPEDIATFFKKLYRKEVISAAVSEEIIKYLSLNNIDDRIPAKLPKDSQNQPLGWKVVHKTGELSRIRHDAGLVYIYNPINEAVESTKSAALDLPKRAYVIVMLSKDLQDENEGVETLANLSRDVYDYFEKKE